MDVRDELIALLRRSRVEEFNEVSRRRQLVIDLREADLTGARMERADLQGVNLDGARLGRACLAGADLRGASLRFANLEGADLEGANLSKANLYSTYLKGARMAGANLHGADVESAVFPDDVRAEELRMSLELGTRLRPDPAVGLLRELLERPRAG